MSNKNRNSMPRTPSQMDSKMSVEKTSMGQEKVINSKTTIEMQKSSSSASSFSSSASSVKSQSSTEESSKVNLMVLPAIDHALLNKDKAPKSPPFADRAGLLSLKHLNTLLLKYIGIVHDLDESKIGEERESTIQIDVDEEEVKFFADMYESEKEKWSQEKEGSEAEINKLKNNLKNKEAELANLKSPVDDKERKELETMIAKLRIEVEGLQNKVNPLLHQEHIFKAQITKLQFQLAFLAAELEGIIREIFNEDVRGGDLKDRLSYLEEELLFKLEVLNKELESEMARTKMDISSMDVRIKGEYINRLKVEVDILRGTYDDFMKVTWEQLEGEYKERLAKLELELSLLINQQSSLEDEGQIMAMIEELKKKIGQLELEHEELKVRCSELSVRIQTDEVEFRAKMSSKEREIDWEIREISRQQEKWEELKRCLMEERVEVHFYDKLLTPEVERMKMRHTSSSAAL